MKKWQLHEAKNKLSDLVDIAMHGKPQCITKRGEEAVIVIGIKEYQKLKQKKLAFNEYLLAEPKFDDLEITRAQGVSREIEL
jgi:prevent-host-death family protein